jgi:hypothetical protein
MHQKETVIMEQQFAAFLPFFTFLSELLESAQQTFMLMVSGEALACFATTTVVVVALWANFYDDSSWVRHHVEQKKQESFEHELFCTVVCALPACDFSQAAIAFAGYPQGPATDSLLSGDPSSIRAARRAFWGATWSAACETLTAEEQMEVYRYAVRMARFKQGKVPYRAMIEPVK